VADTIPLGWRPAYALGVMTGLLYFLGFAGTDVWPLSLVALAPVVVALEGQTPRRGFGIGAAAGLTMNMAGFHWLYGTINTFGGFPAPLSVFFMTVLCAYQGGRIGLFGWLYCRARQTGWPAALVFVLAFSASELLWPLLFPWYFAASVHQVPALMQLAEVGGPYLVGIVLAAPSLALAEYAVARIRRRRVAYGIVIGGVLTPIAAAIAGQARIAQIDARAEASEPVRVGLVQGDMPLIQRREDHTESLRRHLRMTEELRLEGADLVVWSESAVMTAIPEKNQDAFAQRLFTRRLGIPALFGALVVRNGEAGGRSKAFNSALATDADGRIVGRYDKQYLLAFGEYLPFGDQFPVLYDWSPNSGHLNPGSSVDPVMLAGHPVTALVCYEDILPSFVNGAVRHGNPEMLVNMTNDAWFGDSTEPWIHLALAKLRAVEHRRYLLRATNSGVSAVIDPVGRVVANGGTFRQEKLLANAHWMKGPRTGYEVFGDVPWWIAAIAVAAMGSLRRPGRWWLWPRAAVPETGASESSDATPV
jgi:apolipoprotein N-acyltransferase